MYLLSGTCFTRELVKGPRFTQKEGSFLIWCGPDQKTCQTMKLWRWCWVLDPIRSHTSSWGISEGVLCETASKRCIYYKNMSIISRHFLAIRKCLEVCLCEPLWLIPLNNGKKRSVRTELSLGNIYFIYGFYYTGVNCSKVFFPLRTAERFSS